MAAVGLVVAVGGLVGMRLWVDAPAEAGPADTSATAGGRAPVAATEDPAPTATDEELAGVRFTDVTDDVGLADSADEELTLPGINMTSGAAVADVDADGRPDVFLPRVGLPDRLLLNGPDGRFVDVAADAGLLVGRDAEGSSSAAFADIDGDGDLDLYVGPAGRGTGRLWINDGSGHFTEESAARGAQLPNAIDAASLIRGVTFADFDNDGDLDLLVLEWSGWFATSLALEAGERDGTCDAAGLIRSGQVQRPSWAGESRSRLLRNDGSGSFDDATADVGLDLRSVAGFTGQFVDVDADGWQDLLITGDFCTSRLFHNDAGRFRDVTDEAGVGTDENGMGSVARDVDGNGTVDWFITSVAYPTEGDCPMPAGFGGCSGNRLMLNDGHGTYSDGTDAAGVRHGWWGWGAAIEDFAGNGDLQIVQTNGFLHRPEEGSAEDTPATREYFERFADDPIRFWVPTGEGYVDAARQVGLGGRGVGHALVAFDADLDGDLDVLVVDRPGGPTLYRNDRPTDRPWLTVRLHDPGRPGNAGAIGARVRVTPDGGRPVWGWIGTDGSYQSQHLAELHTGFPSGATSARVEVWWPGQGASAAPQAEDVTLNGVVTVGRRS